jgi:hypothetical protein
MKFEYVHEKVSMVEGKFHVDAEYTRDGFTRSFFDAVDSFAKANAAIQQFRRQFREELKLAPRAADFEQVEDRTSF